MSLLKDSPNYLTVEVLKEAYESLRHFVFYEDSPLVDLTLFHQRVRALNTLSGPTVNQYALYDLLVDVLTQQLTTLRKNYHYPVPNPTASRTEVLQALAQDGQCGNEFLVGCSALYVRYVRADLDFSWDELAQALAQHPRTLRRYVKTTWRLLLHTIYRLEHQAWQIEQQHRLIIALPHQTFVQLESQQRLICRACHMLTITSAAIFLHGPAGSGKSATAMQLGYTLIEQSLVQVVAWLDLSNHFAESSSDLAECLANRIRQQLHLPTFDHQSSTEALYNHLTYLVGEEYKLLLIFDGVDVWYEALRRLWPLLSHCVVIVTGRTLPLDWTGSELYCPVLDNTDTLTFLKFLDHRGGRSELSIDGVVGQRLIQIAGGNLAKLQRAYHLWINAVHEKIHAG